jgi:hypothetical protein
MVFQRHYVWIPQKTRPDDYHPDMENGPQLFIKRTYVYGHDGEPKTKKSKRSVMCLPEVVNALRMQRTLTGNRTHIFLTKDGERMNPDHFRDVIWIPALKKADITYRSPIKTRHTFATMMLSTGEDVGWVQNMIGHSSLQMMFQRYYAWIPQKKRSDGQAFRSYKQRVQPQLEEDVSQIYFGWNIDETVHSIPIIGISKDATANNEP